MKNLLLAIGAAFAAFFLFGAPAQAQSCGAPPLPPCQEFQDLPDYQTQGVGGILRNHLGTIRAQGLQYGQGELSNSTAQELCNEIAGPTPSYCDLEVWEEYGEDAAHACGGGGQYAGYQGTFAGRPVCRRHVQGGGISYWTLDPASGQWFILRPNS